MAWKNVTIQFDDDDEIGPQLADDIIGNRRTGSDLSYRDAVQEIFADGLKANRHRCSDPEKLDEWIEEREFLADVHREAKEKAKIIRAYQELGPERFMEKAHEKGMSLEKIERYLGYLKVTPITSWYDKMKRWLSSMLFISNGCADVQMIKQRAIEVGLLTDPDVNRDKYKSEWASIKTCATEMGVSSHKHRGFWKSISDADDMVLQ